MSRWGPDVAFVPADASHIATIAERMRPADRLEVLAASRFTPAEALEKSLQKSSRAWTALVDGNPEVMFGVGDLNVLTMTGAPWLLGTDAVERHFRVFLRQSLDWREQLLQRYAVLRNVVDDRNEVSKRWLQWMGFELSSPAALGVNGEMFRLFEMRR
jgi:hypothetical protein